MLLLHHRLLLVFGLSHRQLTLGGHRARHDGELFASQHTQRIGGRGFEVGISGHIEQIDFWRFRCLLGGRRTAIDVLKPEAG
uniref:Putative secreted peptide n=1 Tax=Anopheles braziliensis TaxID=58242 RepID=A0A2M3ZSM1_9DIPT